MPTMRSIVELRNMRENRSRSTITAIAPAIAPKRAPILMPKVPMTMPPADSITIATPRLAPVDTPSIEGPQSGLLKRCLQQQAGNRQGCTGKGSSDYHRCSRVGDNHSPCLAFNFSTGEGTHDISKRDVDSAPHETRESKCQSQQAQKTEPSSSTSHRYIQCICR